jgi:serine/threonine-protein phosphatase 2A activator
LKLVRKLISTYTLEPAGSHGVWGLDDHAFLPYIFGSAQLSPAATSHDTVPQEGSAPGAPNPSEVTNQKTVDDLRNKNMYFGAIGFIYDVKKGPFWEHSPMLYDISGVSAGWAKINKGMLKMFTVEVLSKFPVVQHFPFGSLFTWEEDQAARQHPSYVQTAKHPKAADTTSAKPPAPASSNVQAQYPTKAPWASTSKPPAPASFSNPESTRVPWAGARPQGFPAATARPLFSSAGAPSAYPAPSTRAPAGTAAPWARAPAAQPPTNPPTGLPTRQSKETQPSPPS